jgi:undecaprenyl-diphosphatase
VIPADHHLAIEERLFRAVNVDAGSWVDGVARVLSSPVFGGTVAVLLAIALWVHRRERGWRWVLALGIALALTDALGSQVLRPLFPRARPVYALPPGTVRFLSPAANVSSIPSLHAANFFAMAVVGAAGWPALAPLLFSLATAVAWSRLYVGVHWPGDVLLGALWGSLWGLVCVNLLRRLLARSGRSP